VAERHLTLGAVGCFFGAISLQHYRLPVTGFEGGRFGCGHVSDWDEDLWLSIAFMVGSFLVRVLRPSLGFLRLTVQPRQSSCHLSRPASMFRVSRVSLFFARVWLSVFY